MEAHENDPYGAEARICDATLLRKYASLLNKVANDLEGGSNDPMIFRFLTQFKETFPMI